jgi:CheY-like chemotaxis protein
MKPGNYLLLKVSDTGVGIDEQTRHRLFEPFFTTKGDGTGVGLGLSSVYGTVKGHNGVILVESELGKGTTFSIYLPIYAPELAAVPEKKKDSAKKGARILVVDDEDIIRTLVSELLSELNYGVICCANGMDAIKYFSVNSSEVDLVLLDMNMPVMSGVDCLSELRKMRKDVKVIISTGYNMETKTQKLFVKGVSGFVKKPFKLDELAEEIERVLKL